MGDLKQGFVVVENDRSIKAFPLTRWGKLRYRIWEWARRPLRSSWLRRLESRILRWIYAERIAAEEDARRKRDVKRWLPDYVAGGHKPPVVALKYEDGRIVPCGEDDHVWHVTSVLHRATGRHLVVCVRCGETS